MSGAWWAVVAGVGFGVFQSLNRRAVSGMDVYLAIFLQLLVSAVVLAGASLMTEDLSLLLHIPVSALVNFGLAGFTHFFVGWTFLNMSQKAIGASRTSPLIATSPLFGAVIAALTLHEFPDRFSLVGMGLMIGGVYLVSTRGGSADASGNGQQGAAASTSGWRGSLYGLAAALSWSISPIFTRQGLQGLPSPVLGVTIGLTVSTVAYGIPLFLRYRQQGTIAASTDALSFKIVAGALAGLSTWGRWIALSLTGVAQVLALSLMSVPTVILLSPLVSGKQQERVTAVLWLGASLIIIGALLLILLN